MRHCSVVIAVALIVLCVSPVRAEDDPRWSFATSVNYSVGDYGTGKDTTFVYVPFTLGVTPLDRFTLSLTVPFVRQTTQTVVRTGGGVAVRRGQQGKQTEEGVGDILLKGSYIVLREQPLLPEVAPYLTLKFPTADEDRGLGTGEFDETVGVDVGKRLVGGLSGFLGLSYTFVGEPSGTDLRDTFGWRVGAAYTVIQPLSVFASLEGATAITPGQEDPLELRAGAEFTLTKTLGLTGSVMKGLSDGSADWGISAGLALRF